MSRKKERLCCEVRKLIIIFLLFSVLLCGCNGQSTTSKPDENTVSVILPTSETAATVNGYLTESALKNDVSETVEYFANKNTKKFHLSTCRYAKSIKEENLSKSKNRKLLISDGYVPCKSCNP